MKGSMNNQTIVGASFPPKAVAREFYMPAPNTKNFAKRRSWRDLITKSPSIPLLKKGGGELNELL
ncbi:MAG: hypothetical protein ACI9CB_002902 [Rhodothermales bacterium]|jgi:hypothetical protein